MPMVSKVGRVVNSHDGLAPRKLHDTLITWYFEIRTKTKNITPLPEFLCSTNLTAL